MQLSTIGFKSRNHPEPCILTKSFYTTWSSMTSLIINHYCDNVTFLKSKLYSKRLFTRCEKVEKKKPLWKLTAYLLLIHCPQWYITVQLLICIKSVSFPFILGDFGCDTIVKLVRKLHQGCSHHSWFQSPLTGAPNEDIVQNHLT